MGSYNNYQPSSFRKKVQSQNLGIKDVQGGFPKSDLLGVTVAIIHVVGQQFLAVCNGCTNP